MSRIPSVTDFHVDVDGIGRFIFARRALRDRYRIRGDYNQLTNGYYDSDGNPVDLAALGFVTVQCLLVSAPDGFSLDKLDPNVEEDCDDKVMKVFMALRAKEASFRPKPAQPVQEERPEPSAHVRDGVPPPLQPAVD